eukprot:tig00000492_g1520.t1
MAVSRQRAVEALESAIVAPTGLVREAAPPSDLVAAIDRSLTASRTHLALCVDRIPASDRAYQAVWAALDAAVGLEATVAALSLAASSAPPAPPPPSPREEA